MFGSIVKHPQSNRNHYWTFSESNLRKCNCQYTANPAVFDRSTLSGYSGRNLNNYRSYFGVDFSTPNIKGIGSMFSNREEAAQHTPKDI